MTAVKFDVHGRIATITMNRPEKLNAINHDMIQGLFEAFHELNSNPDIWVGVLAGEGRAFSTGHDLVMGGSSREVKPGVPTGNTDNLYSYMQSQIDKPLIAAPHGHALAQGAGLALLCDFIIAADDTKFGWPQVKRGIASISGPTILAHAVPFRYALMMLFTGEFIDAEAAYRVGLVQEILPRERQMDRVYEIAESISANAPLAVRTIKRAALSGRSIADFDERVQNSVRLAKEVRETEDAKEGLRAFAEKRRAEFKGQ